MKVFINSDWVENEEYYISEHNGELLEIDDTIIENLRAANKAQGEAYSAFTDAIQKARGDKQKETALDRFFNTEHHSRSTKTRYLTQNGWKQIDTSTFRKHGQVLAMHEAFEKEKVKYLKGKTDGQ